MIVLRLCLVLSLAWYTTDLYPGDLSPQIQLRLEALQAEEAQLWEYGRRQAVTPQQFDAIMAWAESIRQLLGTQHEITAAALSTAGTLTLRAEAFQTSKALFKESLAIREQIFGEKSEQASWSHLDLAHFYVVIDEQLKTSEHARAAAEINEAIYGANHPNTMRAFLPMGDAMYSVSEYATAVQYYTWVATAFDQHLGPGQPEAISARERIGQIFVEVDQLEDAIEAYEQVLAGLQAQPEIDQNAIARAELQLTVLRIDPADPGSIRRVASTVDTFKRRHPDELGFANDLEDQLVLNLFATGKRRDRQGAFAMVDESIRRLAQSVRRELWNIPPDKQSDYLSFAGAEKFFEAVSIALDYKDDPTAARLSAEWLINAKGLVRETQSLQAGAFADLVKRDAWVAQPYVELADLQAKLPKNGYYVDMLRYLDTDFSAATATPPTARYAAWIIPKRGVPKLLDLGEADPLDLLIVALREELSKPLKGVTVKTAIASARSTLGDVSHRIWHPLFAHVKQADGIIISPDQGLWLLPWAAMLNPDDTFATERFPLQLELSGRELVRVHQRGLLGPAAVFANPAYGTVPASTTNAKGLRIGSAGPLPNTAKEAAAIAPLLAQLTQQPPLVLLTTAATEATFKALNSPSIVVLSTHGFYLDAEGQILKAAALQSGAEVAASPLQDLIPSLVQQNPLLQCGLLLADANRHTAIERLVNDGVLTGAEIVSVDLKNTRLAVLSACETGLGSLDAAGGVIGLRRAFHVAGVHSVVASLWQVPDRETAILMETFFTRLVSVRDVAAALQFAQQSLIDEQRKRNGWAHPFFWAAFNVSGRADLTL